MSTTERGRFADRHIGPNDAEARHMLAALGSPDLDGFLDEVVPRSIRRRTALSLPSALSETEALAQLSDYASENTRLTSLIGMGYANTITPPAIARNVLENPAWYTAYTPYQAEISQGRLEALLLFQTMIADLTAMEIANASLLDEATAAVEAMLMARRVKAGDTFLVEPDSHPQIRAVLETRAEPLGIRLVTATEWGTVPEGCFGALLAYPTSSGLARDLTPAIDALHKGGALAIVSSDLLSLTLLKPPGEMGADMVIGSSQRYGVPLGFGGPHAAFLAAREAFKRQIPGRIVGVSRDKQGKTAYRLALQTREQHIRRDRATSNICTAQVLPAVMAAFYAVWHGPDGLSSIAGRVNRIARLFAASASKAGLKLRHTSFFDTVTIETGDRTEALFEQARDAGFNLRRLGNALGVAFDEVCDEPLLERLLSALDLPHARKDEGLSESIPEALKRSSAFLTHPAFSNYRSETEAMRYFRRLADKDLALDRTMIPLGSCTMKLNAAAEMTPISWPGFSAIHPFAPDEQTKGYAALTADLEDWLCRITGAAAVSLQPNAGAQGEFAGLNAIRAWHQSRGEGRRTVCLIPASAHGTNPASAVLAGFRVVEIACDAKGNVSLDDVRAKAEAHANELAAIMITYPSTHGVFEESILEIGRIVHRHGGQVYIDGANFNALVGLVTLFDLGADAAHVNLHKTFAIPHGGGGPGVGPAAVAKHLVPFLPGDPCGGRRAVSAARFGNAGVLPISWAYIAMMGNDGLKRATEQAILSANYIARRLDPHYPVLFRGAKERVAHECIVDARDFKETAGVSNEDIAKRLIDYGFHAPTMSFPVPGTLMIEPTESESLAEIDRFCDAMIAIRREIAAVESGEWPRDDNPLVNAPHPLSSLTAEEWPHPYSRAIAVTPQGGEAKYWPPVARVDSALGDRNLVCCLSVEDDAMPAYRVGAAK